MPVRCESDAAPRLIKLTFQAAGFSRKLAHKGVSCLQTSHRLHPGLPNLKERPDETRATSAMSAKPAAPFRPARLVQT